MRSLAKKNYIQALAEEGVIDPWGSKCTIDLLGTEGANIDTTNILFREIIISLRD
jgi:hypothetical protein